MTRTINAIIDGGVFRSLEHVVLQDQQLVRLIVMSLDDSEPTECRTFLEVANELEAVGCAADLPADLSTNPFHLEGLGRS